MYSETKVMKMIPAEIDKNTEQSRLLVDIIRRLYEYYEQKASPGELDNILDKIISYVGAFCVLPVKKKAYFLSIEDLKQKIKEKDELVAFDMMDFVTRIIEEKQLS